MHLSIPVPSQGPCSRSITPGMFKRRETKDRYIDDTLDSRKKRFLGISHMHELLNNQEESFMSLFLGPI